MAKSTTRTLLWFVLRSVISLLKRLARELFQKVSTPIQSVFTIDVDLDSL